MSRKVENMFRRSVGAPLEEAIEPEEIEEAGEYYINTKGEKHLIRDMPDGYIHNAVAKLKRATHPTVLTKTTIASMDKEIERRSQGD